MSHFLIDFAIKDWFIVLALIILLFSIIRVRRLKKIVSEETLNRLMPMVGLIIEGDMNSKDFYLTNYSTSIAKNIHLDDTEISIDDFGFKIPLKIVFESVDSLNPVDKMKLNYKIFLRGSEVNQDTKDIYMSHFLFTDFDSRVHYENIHNARFCSQIMNRTGKFSIRGVFREK
jgi:hypothetical protein